MGFDLRAEIDPTCQNLERLAEQIKFRKWYFGHVHVDQSFGKFKSIYNEVEMLEEY